MARIYLDARAVLGPSGLRRYCEGLIPPLAELGRRHEFVVVRLRRGNPTSFSSAPNVREVYVDGVTGTLPLLASRGRLARVFRDAGAPDLLHALFHVVPFGVRRLPAAPTWVVVTLHDLIWVDHARLVEPTPAHAWWRRFLGSTAIRYALGSADHVVCNSEATRRSAERWISGSRCSTVYHGVADEFFASREVLSSASSRPYVAAFGVPKAYKNLKCLVRAFALLAAARPDLTLVLLGGDGGARGEIDRLGLADRITVRAPIADPELRRIMRHAAVFVVPSIVEGFGLPALEAMALGTPLIVSDTPALREVAGDAALRFDPRQPADLASVITSLLDDERLRMDMCARGLQRAREFRWERCARQTLAVYDDLLGSASNSPSRG
jgi:glycosyltransferase involved in cell wall biosynthesis